MSQIDKLIADLCPDGVEFKRIADVSSKGSKIKWAQVGNAEYQYIDLGAVEPRTRQIGKTQAINSRNAPSRAQQIVHSGDIIFATTRPTQLRWTVIPDSYDGQVVSTGYCVIRPDRSSIITNYLAHTLGTTSFLKYLKANQILGNYPSIPDSRIQEFRVPVPPLEVQREIVRVLDKFTQLEAELEAELEARQRQYEYYRKQLFGFSKSTSWVLVGEIGEVRSGWGFPKSYQGQKVGGIPFYKVSDMNLIGNETSMTNANNYVCEDVVKELKVNLAPAGTVIFPKIGAAIATNKKRLLSIDSAYDNNVMGIIPGPKAESRFLLYWMQQVDLSQLAHHSGAVPSIRKTEMERLEVPLPPLEEQRRIVSILDKFDSLVNDLSIGLPAELAARRKQYEYYRDRLLTFEEKR